MDRQDGWCFGGDVNRVAKEVLDSHGQEVVRNHVACGDMERAVEAVVVGVAHKVSRHDASPEQLGAWRVLLGISSGSIPPEFGWD